MRLGKQMKAILEYLAEIGIDHCQRESKIIRRIYGIPVMAFQGDTTITPSQRSSVSRSLARLIELGLVRSERFGYYYEYAPIKVGPPDWTKPSLHGPREGHEGDQEKIIRFHGLNYRQGDRPHRNQYESGDYAPIPAPILTHNHY